jgi:hypothetical protein
MFLPHGRLTQERCPPQFCDFPPPVKAELAGRGRHRPLCGSAGGAHNGPQACAAGAILPAAAPEGGNAMSGLGRCAAVAVAWLALSGRAAAVTPEIRDEGKFFSADAIKKANEIIREIYGKYDRDLLIETFATVPGGEDERDKVKRMDAKEKSEYFRKWAIKRAETAVVNGVYILVCKDPTNFQIQITKKGRTAFDRQSFMKLRETILDEFRDKRFDEGLLAGVKFVRDQFAAAAKK